MFLVFSFVGDSEIITEIKRGGEVAARPGIVSAARVVYLCRSKRMSDEITYRKATTADAGAIARVQVGSWRASFQGILDQAWLESFSVELRTEAYAHRLADRRQFYEMLVAEHVGEVIGICDVGAARVADAYGCAAELYSFYLNKSYQRRGIGHRLFRAAAELLVANGRESVYLEVLEVNPYRGFYDKLGGEIVGRGLIDGHGREYATLFYKWADLPRTLHTLTERAC